MQNQLENLVNDIGNLNGTSIIDYALEVIRTNESRGNLFPVWSYLTLIQFAILYSSESKLLPHASISDNRRLLDKITKIQDDYLLNEFGFLDGTSTRKTMSVLSNQQFWMYNSLPEYDIVRQLFLFIDLDNNRNSFQNLFKQKYNIDIFHFLQMAFYCYLAFGLTGKKEFNGKVNPDLLGLIKIACGDREQKAFLSLLTLGMEKAKKQDLLEILKLRSLSLQPFDIRHWLKKPFILHKGEFKVISLLLFNQTIKSFIFDSLKQEPLFQNLFSTTRFETYIEKGLKEVTIEFKNEKKLKNTYPSNSKMIDFLIEDSVLVECKATELTPLPSVLPEDESVYKALKTSVVKGFSQLYEFARLLNKENCFGVIITYKPMYLGDGIDISLEFMKNFVANLSDDDFLRIPIENIFILSIDEWDKALQLCNYKKFTLSELLNKIRAQHKINRGYFEGHIMEIAGNEEIPPFSFLQERYENFREMVLNDDLRNQVLNSISK